MMLLSENSVLKSLFNVPIYLAASVLCLIGFELFPSEIGDRNVRFVYAALTVLTCATITWIFNTKKLKPGIVDFAAVAMFVWYVVAYHANGSIVASKLFETCMFAFLYVSLRVLLSSYRNLGKWLLVVLCVCGIVEATMGIRQAFGAELSNHSLFRVTGTFFNPGPYGGYLAVILSTALGYVASHYRYADNIFGKFRKQQGITLRNVFWALVFCVAAAAIVNIAIILPATMSRAAFLAAGIAGIAIVLSNNRVYAPIADYVRRHKNKALVIGIVSVVIICGGAYGIYTMKKDSADGRLLMWKITVGVMVENPVTGVGPGYFRGAYGDLQAEYFGADKGSDTEINIAGCPEYGFNEYLQTGAETGIPGLLVMIFLTGVALWRLFRAHSPYALGLLALMVFAFFSYPFSLLPMKILFVMLLAIAGSCRPKRRDATVAQRVVVGAIFAGCVGMAIFVIKPYFDRIEATKKWQELRRWYSMEMYSDILEDYRKLLPLMGENPVFMFEYGRSLNQEERYIESLDILLAATRLSNDPMNYNVIGNNYKALGEYDKAAEAYLKAYCIVPNRMYQLYQLAKMYLEIRDYGQARHYARRVVEMIPKVPSSATDDMQREMKELFEKKADRHCRNIKNI